MNQFLVEKYDYINDYVNQGTGVVGFIAQQIETVDLNAISFLSDYIPNINGTGTMKLVYHKQNSVEWTYELTVYSPDFNKILVGDECKIIHLSSNQIYSIPVQTILTNQNCIRFTIRSSCQEGDVFVYGTKVNDFHYLDKDRIFAYGIGAIQDLSKQNDALREENKLLKERLALQEDTLTRVLLALKQSTSFADLQGKL